MNILRLGRFLRGMAVAAALAAVPAVAQEDEAAQPSDPGPAVSPDAGPAVERDSIDAYQVRLAETDYMAGRLRVVDPITGEVRGIRKTGLLIIQGGKVVGRAETGVNGVAQIKSLPIGAYSVVAIGPDGMAAFGLEVLPLASGVSIPSYRFDTLVVPPTDLAVAQRAICGGGGPLPAVPVPAAEIPPAPVPPVPVAFQEPAVPDEAYEVASVSSPLKGEPILVREGESGVGHLIVLDPRTGAPAGMANARVSFLRGGRLLGSVETDSQGNCGVIGLEDGYYSMVGVGPNGFVAMGVRVGTIPAATAEAAAGSDAQVSLLQPVPGVDWRVAGCHADAIAFAPGFGCGACGQPACCGQCGIAPGGPCPGGPCGPGGFAGFGGGGGFGAGGGGGFFGGGGLLGGLIGAGVGAAVGAAVADDDDEGGQQVIIVSPNNPPAGP